MPDKTLHYEERGEGVPVVLLHGFPFDHSIWRNHLEDAPEGTRLLAPDLPGFGGSDPLGAAEPSMEAYADEIASWANRMDLGGIVLVGHSMGGYIAFAFARKYPRILAGLGLVCTRPGPDTSEGREGRYKLINAVQEKGPQAVVDAMLPKLFSPRTREQNPDLIDEIRELMLRQSPEGIVAALRAMAERPDSTPMLSDIKVPTLVISGDDDVIIPAQDAVLLASTIPGARHESIAGAGHLPMLEQPEEFTTMLTDLARGATTNPQIPEPPDRRDMEGVRRHD